MKRKQKQRSSSAPMRRLAATLLCALGAMLAVIWVGWYSPWATADPSVRVVALDAPPVAPPGAPVQVTAPAAAVPVAAPAPDRRGARADDARQPADRGGNGWRPPEGAWVPPVSANPADAQPRDARGADTR